MNLDPSTLLTWSEPREIPRLNKTVRNAEPTDAFRALWRDNQAELKQRGIGWSEWPKGSGKWQVSWWQDVSQTVLEQRQASAELSRAATSSFEPPCPAGLGFYPFQKAGIDFMRQRPATLLADDMGIGKTIQAIGVINCEPSIERVLVVTKASLKENWKREMKKWLVRPMEIGIATGQYWPSHANVICINYDVLGKWPNKLRAKEWDLVILDESAAIKNREAKRTIAIVGRKGRKTKGETDIPPIPAKRRLCLSGTPIENRPEELWTTLYFLDPARWGSFYGYAKRYCGMVSNGYGVDCSGATNLDELQRILRETLMIRRRKADVLTELPPKTRVVVELDTDGLEDAIADEERCFERHRNDLEQAQAKIELARASESDEEFKTAVKGLASATVAFTEMARVRHNTAVSKLPQVIAAIREDMEETGRKMILFGHHRDVLHPLAEAFPGSVLITGETPPELRQGICDRFQTDPNCGPFIGSIRACGEGLTLTAARLVIFIEQDWCPGKVSQAEDRAHRIGQKDNVLVKHYVLPGTIDARMIQTIVAKQEVIDKALDDDPGEWATEPAFVPKHEPIGKRKEIAEEALLITEAQRCAIHTGLQRLAGMCDGAQVLDGAGFNKIDAMIGHQLAELPNLTMRQAALGRRIARKYSKQLGQIAVNQMG